MQGSKHNSDNVDVTRLLKSLQDFSSRLEKSSDPVAKDAAQRFKSELSKMTKPKS